MIALLSTIKSKLVAVAGMVLAILVAVAAIYRTGADHREDELRADQAEKDKEVLHEARKTREDVAARTDAELDDKLRQYFRD